MTKVGFTRFPLAPHIQMSNQSPQSVEFQKEDPQQMSCCRAGNSLGLSTPDRLPTEISGECVAIGCDDTPPLASVEMKNDTTQNERSTFTQLTSQGGSTFREWGGSLTAGRRGGSDDSAAARSTHSRHTDIRLNPMSSSLHFQNVNQNAIGSSDSLVPFLFTAG